MIYYLAIILRTPFRIRAYTGAHTTTMTLALIEQLALIRAETLSLLVVVEIIRQKRNAVIGGTGRKSENYHDYIVQ